MIVASLTREVEAFVRHRMLADCLGNEDGLAPLFLSSAFVGTKQKIPALHLKIVNYAVSGPRTEAIGGNCFHSSATFSPMAQRAIAQHPERRLSRNFRRGDSGTQAGEALPKVQ